jgi:hypothetical protein
MIGLLFISNNPLAPELVIPAQAGIQLIKKSPRSGSIPKLCPLRGLFFFAGFPPARE